MVDTTKFIPRTADDIEGDIGGCTMDALRDDDRYFETPPDSYDIQWFISRERSTLAGYEDMPRFALAIHEGKTYLLDNDKYTAALEAEDLHEEAGEPDSAPAFDIDHAWALVT